MDHSALPLDVEDARRLFGPVFNTSSMPYVLLLSVDGEPADVLMLLWLQVEANFAAPSVGIVPSLGMVCVLAWASPRAYVKRRRFCCQLAKRTKNVPAANTTARQTATGKSHETVPAVVFVLVDLSLSSTRTGGCVDSTVVVTIGVGATASPTQTSPPMRSTTLPLANAADVIAASLSCRNNIVVATRPLKPHSASTDKTSSDAAPTGAEAAVR